MINYYYDKDSVHVSDKKFLEALFRAICAIRTSTLSDKYRPMVKRVLFSILNGYIGESQFVLLSIDDTCITHSEYEHLVKKEKRILRDVKRLQQYFKKNDADNAIYVPHKKGVELVVSYVDSHRRELEATGGRAIAECDNALLYEVLTRHMEYRTRSVSRVNREHWRGIADYYLTSLLYDPGATVYSELSVYDADTTYPASWNENTSREGDDTARKGLIYLLAQSTSFRADAFSYSVLPDLEHGAAGAGSANYAQNTEAAEDIVRNTDVGTVADNITITDDISHPYSLIFFEHDTSSQRSTEIWKKLLNYTSFFDELAVSAREHACMLLFGLSTSYANPDAAVPETLRLTDAGFRGQDMDYECWYHGTSLPAAGAESTLNRNERAKLYNYVYQGIALDVKTFGKLCALYKEFAEKTSHLGTDYARVNASFVRDHEWLTKLGERFKIKDEVPIMQLLTAFSNHDAKATDYKAEQYGLNRLHAFLQRKNIIGAEFEDNSPLYLHAKRGKRICCIPERSMYRFLPFLLPYEYGYTERIFDHFAGMGYSFTGDFTYTPYFRRTSYSGELTLCNHYAASMADGGIRHFVFENYSLDFGTKARLYELARCASYLYPASGEGSAGQHEGAKDASFGAVEPLTVIVFFLSYELPEIKKLHAGLKNTIMSQGAGIFTGSKEGFYTASVTENIEILYWCMEDFLRGAGPLCFNLGYGAEYIDKQEDDFHYYLYPSFTCCELRAKRLKRGNKAPYGKPYGKNEDYRRGMGGGKAQILEKHGSRAD